jgi:hypothetical protein
MADKALKGVGLSQEWQFPKYEYRKCSNIERPVAAHKAIPTSQAK